MSPQNLSANGNPPVHTTPDDGGGCGKWTIALLALILLLVLLAPVLPYLVNVVVWILALPFKLIGMIVRACKKSKPKSNAEAPPDADKLKGKAEKKR